MGFKLFTLIFLLLSLSLLVFNTGLSLNSEFVRPAQAEDSIDTLINKHLTNTGTIAGIDTKKASRYQTIFWFLGLIIWLFVGFVGFLFFAQLVLGGLHWILSGGNEEKIQKAQSRIYNAAIGITVFLAAYFLTNFMFKYFSSYLGFELFSF